MTAPAAPTVAGLSIGPIDLDVPVVLAPMAGVTNAPFRRLCRAHGAGLYVSEMITARAFLEGNAKTRRLTHFDADEPVRSTQLYGIDPTEVGEAVRRLVEEVGVHHVDLNFGCPVAKVTRNGGGAALPVRRRLLSRIMRSAVRAAEQASGGAVPVTAKFRMGIDDDHLTFLETGRRAVDAGCAAIALHARTATQLYSGTADWDAIGELKAAVPEIPVLGNGDVWEAADAVRMVAQTGCDGVVIGRGCLGRPWLFGDLGAAFAGRPVPDPPLLGEVTATMLTHLDLLQRWAGEWLGVREFRKHTGWYLKGYPVGNALRRSLNVVESSTQLAAALESLDPTTAMTAEGRRAKRGHQQGPRPVSLPDGWYDLADSDDALADGAEAPGSGG
ncbi:MAG: tRNA dihydrouridine synthase DusB [Microthrixaceae bacterium]